MEKLKSVIPEALKYEISESTTAGLHFTCSSLLDFFQTLPLFHQMIRDLTDPEMALCGKNEEAAMEAKVKGNQCFSKGDYTSAMSFYSQALRSAPIYVEDQGKNLVATLRAKANSSLGNYEDARNDLIVSLKIETSSSGKRQIESELKILLDQSRVRSGAVEKSNGSSTGSRSCVTDDPLQAELRCISTITKGRGMASSTNIPLASLIHKEDPYAAIILKHCRETHCAFCFNELPADTVPCVSCSIPLYCSMKCQVLAGGQDFSKYLNKYGFPKDLSEDIGRYFRNVTSLDDSSSGIKPASEHKHECQGLHWSAVLPSDVVLVGRILVKHIEEQSSSGLDPHIHGILIIILLSKIRVNSMAIVQMKCSDVKQPLQYDATSSMEQVQVAQAVYSGASLFNHSCQPNVHAYFLSRTLYVRATENVTAGSELELCYGPQVGQWDCSKRRKYLEDKYSFICQCRCCAQVNLSDIVHSGYRCAKPNCFGVVLDSSVAEYEKDKAKLFEGPDSLQVNTLNHVNISKVAHHLFEQTDFRHCFEPGHCLSCSTSSDLQASKNTIAKAEIQIGRMHELVASGAITTNFIMDALRCLDILRAVLHPFNKRIAEMEDNMAQAFCLTGELQSAMDHCRASIMILETLYGENHIVIGNELIKEASIQVSMGQNIPTRAIKRIVAIFSRYYGCHAEIIFPYFRYLKSKA